MRGWLGAASVYFVLVYMAGMLLGSIRILFVEPWLGELPAVLIELPLMLALAWWLCGAILRRFQVPPRPAPRLAMGGFAFLLLLAGELALSLYAVEGSVAGHLRAYADPARLAGLIGQVAFALFPLLRLPREARAASAMILAHPGGRS